MQTITGLATARGFASGPAFIYRGDGEIAVPEYRIASDQTEAEVVRLMRAINETRRDLENLISVLRERTGGDDVNVFDCHLMILDDPELRRGTLRYINEEYLNAAAAIRKTADDFRERFGRMNDPYFRERIRDLEDVERRILKAIIGFGVEPQQALQRPSIVIADELTPAETVRLPREYVLGFATNGGSTTSHVALLARAMGIPAVSGLGNITEKVQPGDPVLLDGTNGVITVAPDRATLREFLDLVERQKEISEEVASGLPAGTLKGGGQVRLLANVHPGVPLDDIRELGASGVGLYRSEYLWLGREHELGEEEQFAAYREAVSFVAALSETASTTIRVLDVGGDKLVRGLSGREANPFLGNRSIRYLLTNRGMFKTQLRAILRASAFGRVKLMYPMIACVEELRAANALLEVAKAELEREGVAFDRKLPVGVMIEVPAAALNAEALARQVDFFSIGTNDLVQYTMAADRGNEAVANLYQPTNPAVLKLVRGTIAAAKRQGIPVSVCGESAADPVVGTLWAAMGVDTLSMSATYIPVMSKLFSRLTRADLDAYAAMVAALDDGLEAAEIRRRCREFLLARVPDLDNIAI